MKPVTSPCLMLLLCLLSAAACARDLQADYSALVAVQDASRTASEKDAATSIAQAYQKHFEPTATGAIEALSTADVDIVFRAANIAAGYTFDRTYALQMKRAYDLLAQRDALRARYPQSMLEVFVFARMLDEARRFAEATPSLGVTLPTFKKRNVRAGRPTLWTFEDGGGALVQRAADLDAPMIVVVSHPLCGFSQAAATQILEDEDLRARFMPPSVWLLPQTALFDAREVQAWEAAHHPFTMAYANTQAEWPMIDSWATPTFYFLKGGKVVHKVVGWPAEGRKAELREGLAKLDAG